MNKWNIGETGDIYVVQGQYLSCRKTCIKSKTASRNFEIKNYGGFVGGNRGWTAIVAPGGDIAKTIYSHLVYIKLLVYITLRVLWSNVVIFEDFDIDSAIIFQHHIDS